MHDERYHSEPKPMPLFTAVGWILAWLIVDGIVFIAALVVVLLTGASVTRLEWAIGELAVFSLIAVPGIALVVRSMGRPETPTSRHRWFLGAVHSLGAAAFIAAFAV